ncbi:MAG: type II toxin-antitoxin system YafQ family toxin [Bacteroidales bacterium]|jgi:mRNA interferase YafQ|nr:type II toxin-antitoxin system YafQ family toxin [Bacteroidales bacterium]
MSYSINYSKRFEKDVKRCKKRGYKLQALFDVIGMLEDTGALPPEYHPHKLSGDREGQWECHIQSDWLLVWAQNDTELTLLFLETGTHSDLY